MPHVSNRKVDGKSRKKIEDLLLSYLVDASGYEREKIFMEIVTPTERTMIGKRLLMIYMLDRGAPLYQVSKVLGVSFSTVARFQLRLERGKFSAVRRWLKSQFGSRWIRKMVELAIIPFALQRKSLRYLLHD